MGGETVLLRYDEKAAGWFRVDPRAAVVPGERVLALPEFRPKIALVSGVHLDLSGGTQVVMGGGDASASAKQAEAEFIPTIELVYGRAVLINPTNGEKQIRLRLGSAIGTAKLRGMPRSPSRWNVNTYPVLIRGRQPRRLMSACSHPMGASFGKTQPARRPLQKPHAGH